MSQAASVSDVDCWSCDEPVGDERIPDCFGQMVCIECLTWLAGVCLECAEILPEAEIDGDPK